MIVMRIGNLGFKKRPDMTMRQYENYQSFLGGKDEQVINDGTFMYVIADTFDDALEKMRNQVASYVGNIGWLKADLADFYFTEYHDEAVDGMFWRPSTTHCMKYRLSDGKVL